MGRPDELRALRADLAALSEELRIVREELYARRHAPRWPVRPQEAPDIWGLEADLARLRDEMVRREREFDRLRGAG